jgi:hypothetical protein
MGARLERSGQGARATVGLPVQASLAEAYRAGRPDWPPAPTMTGDTDFDATTHFRAAERDLQAWRPSP